MLNLARMASLLAPNPMVAEILHSSDSFVGPSNRATVEMSDHFLSALASQRHETPWDVFSANTAHGMGTGIVIGSMAGRVATAIPDFLVGDGDPSSSDSSYDLKSEGLFGVAYHAAVERCVIRNPKAIEYRHQQ